MRLLGCFVGIILFIVGILAFSGLLFVIEAGI
jgi:hypothetical protein